jgi:hypothetical protein
MNSEPLACKTASSLASHSSRGNINHASCHCQRSALGQPLGVEDFLEREYKAALQNGLNGKADGGVNRFENVSRLFA